MVEFEKINKEHYRVAIFGSARIKENDDRYKQVYDLAEKIAGEGFDIVTGGGPSLMDAASRGHLAGRKGNNVHTIGLTIKLPREQIDSFHLDIKKNFNRFSNRLDSFMELSDAVIVAPGGIGTMLELFYTWQLVQVGHICEIPIILLGEHWHGLISWMQKNLVEEKLMNSQDMGFVFIAKNVEEVLHLLKQFHENHTNGKDICKNITKYVK